MASRHSIKTAVVHDYFTQIGGAERVAEEIYRMYPDSQLFATVALDQFMPGILQGVEVKTSWMQKLPSLDRFYRYYFMLYPLAVHALDLKEYDVVISSSSGYAKGVTTRYDAVHVCYCHNPMRWAWNYQGYSNRESFNPIQRHLLPVMIRTLQNWDMGASRQPDHFIANSKVVAERIHTVYGRTAEVIHPPINIKRFYPSEEREDYYIVLARLAPYKRIDLAVSACTARGTNLVVIGEGTDRAALESLAGPTVKFVGRVSDREVAQYVSRCKGLIFPGEEDFGMAPVEVAAAGRPTIAYRAGGATETIVEGVTGVFFSEQTTESLMEAMDRFEQQPWDPEAIRAQAQRFSTEVFQQRMGDFLKRVGAA
jgi:glycosyltransferase involved in cell wall biosynthesis